MAPTTLEQQLQQAFQLHQAGDLAKAAGLYKKVLRQAPKNADAHYLLGVASLQQGAPAEGAKHLQRALQFRPDFIDARFQLGNIFASEGRHAEALPHYEAVLKADPKNAGAHINLGNLHQALGAGERALRHYETALELDPALAMAHNGIGLLHQAQGQYEKAVEHYQKALALAPNDPGLLNNLGTAYKDWGRLDEAVDHYRRAVARAPKAATYANLATVLERAHRHAESKTAVAEALALDPGHGEARLLQARLLNRQGDSRAAQNAYENLIQDLQNSLQESAQRSLARAQSDLAALYEKAGDFRRAFALFSDANATNCQGNPQWQAHSDAYIARVESLLRRCDSLPGNNPSVTAPSDAAPAPIFMVGFPRSGTTLLDQILNSHSKVTVMEEKTVIDKMVANFDPSGTRAFDDILTVSDGDRAALRQAYWQGVGQNGIDLAPGRRLVDKLPLNLLNLWFIHGIFPDAKIILSIRDPRDVCLSCFTNLFRLGDGLAGFPTLDHAARLYAAAMNLTAAFREKLPLALQEVRYENLVEDLEREARRTLEFLALDWEDAVLDYRETAQNRYIVTPSYPQVVQPLYRSSIARWSNYEAELRPIEDHLAPFVRAFGYK